MTQCSNAKSQHQWNVWLLIRHYIFSQRAVEVVKVRVQTCSDSKTGRFAYNILELVESNRSAYVIYWITCDVNRKRTIRGKYYRTRNGRKGLYMRKGKGDTCSQNHYSSNVAIVSATTNRQRRNCCMVSASRRSRVGVGINREGKKCKALRYIKSTFTFTFT